MPKEQGPIEVESIYLDEINSPVFPENATKEQREEILSQYYAEVNEALFKDKLNDLTKRKPSQDSHLSEHIGYNTAYNDAMEGMKELDPTLSQKDKGNTNLSKPSLLRRSSSISSATPTSLLSNVVPDNIMYQALKGEPAPQPVTKESLERLEQMSKGPPPPPANIPSVPDQDQPYELLSAEGKASHKKSSKPSTAGGKKRIKKTKKKKKSKKRKTKRR